MNKVEFDEIKYGLDIFWGGGREYDWYQKAWSILDELGLTSYKTKADKHNVYIRALTLSMLYGEFCKLAFDEFHEYECFNEMYEDELEEVLIGQLYSKLPDNVLTSDMNYILCRLADSKRQEVFSALRKKLDETYIFLGMYFTAITPVDEDDNPIDVGNTYEEYWDFIEGKTEVLLDAICPVDEIIYEGQSAYSWLLEGTYRVGWFYNSDNE